jgi:hypothetical protein
MKTRITILIVLIALLFLGTISRATADKPYAITPGAASGGGYRLAGPVWRVSGVIHGGGYRLVGSAGSNNGYLCCCTYLPCIPRE